METRKRRFGDRKDGYRVRGLDALHSFTPYMMPNRADNEAFIQEQIDVTNMMAYLEKKKQEHPEEHYSFFHVIAAATVKTITLRPRMNRFIAGRRLYDRSFLALAFVVKKQFKDDSHEALAFIKFAEDSTFDSAHKQIMDEINFNRHEGITDNSTKGMDILGKLPRWLMRIIMGILNILDYHGRVPDFLVKTDPDYATVFISNLGSIQLNAAYHHLNNWGTNSLFCVIGEKKLTPFYDEKGNVTMRPTVGLGLTLDERIADGYYYSRTIKLLKHLLENPELLDVPANVPVEF